MSDIQESSVSFAGIAATPLGRRKVMGSMAALSVAATIGAPALASPRTAVTTYTGRYGIPGGAIIDGFMAAPRGKASLPILVLMPGNGQSAAARRAMATDYAAAGYLAIAPDRVMGSADERLSAVLPGLRKVSRGNGTIRVLSV